MLRRERLWGMLVAYTVSAQQCATDIAVLMPALLLLLPHSAPLSQHHPRLSKTTSPAIYSSTVLAVYVLLTTTRSCGSTADQWEEECRYSYGGDLSDLVNIQSDRWNTRLDESSQFEPIRLHSFYLFHFIPIRFDSI